MSIDKIYSTTVQLIAEQEPPNFIVTIQENEVFFSFIFSLEELLKLSKDISIEVIRTLPLQGIQVSGEILQAAAIDTSQAIVDEANR